MPNELETLMTHDYNYHVDTDGHDINNLMDESQLRFITGTPVLNGNPSWEDIKNAMIENIDGFRETDRYIVRVTKDPNCQNDLKMLHELEKYRPLREDDFVSNYIYDKNDQKIIKYW